MIAYTQSLMLKSYLITLTTVISSTRGYLDLLRDSWRSTWAFFVITLFLLSLSSIAHFYIKQVPEYKKDISQTFSEIATHYPADFSMVWNGQFLTMTGVPLKVGYPAYIQADSYRLPQFLFQFQDQEAYRDQLKDTQSLFVITPSAIYAQNRTQEWVDFKIADALDANTPFEINATNLPNVLGAWRETADSYLSLVTTGIAILLPFWLILSRVWDALLNSILLYFFFRLDSIAFKWKKCLQLALYVTIPAELIHQISDWLYPSLSLPMFAISFWTILMIIYYTLRPELKKI